MGIGQTLFSTPIIPKNYSGPDGLIFTMHLLSMLAAVSNIVLQTFFNICNFRQGWSWEVEMLLKVGYHLSSTRYLLLVVTCYIYRQIMSSSALHVFNVLPIDV